MTQWFECKRVPKLFIFNAYGPLPLSPRRGVVLARYFVLSGLGADVRGKKLI